MLGMAAHELLPLQNSDERARHSFLIDLKIVLQDELIKGVRESYEKRARPADEAATGRSHKDRHDAARALEHDPSYQLWSALGRIQQDLYVDSTAECVERQLPRLQENYQRLVSAPQKHGTLALDPAITPPRYISVVDIHCIPGGYFSDHGDDDIAVGARYDIGSYIFGRGQRGSMNDTRGQTGVKFIKTHWPDFKPRRILDLGCTAGMNTLPYVDAFPDAEVYAIDLSAPALRYAHGRAEAVGRKVHFSQQNAESTNFPDGYFDLVVSHILFHETSRSGVEAILKEAQRLLAPGGRTLHLDVSRRLTCTGPFDQFIADWDTLNNNEPFWGTFLFDMDVPEAARQAGFSHNSVREELTPTPSGKALYWALSALKGEA
ncbi:MAG TPA: class I SAM-dependent methyltransferase [Terricaulis sp.]|nr:class I SAM-dependent methyltransferase [Terricaulis sp.]